MAQHANHELRREIKRELQPQRKADGRRLKHATHRRGNSGGDGEHGPPIKPVSLECQHEREQVNRERRNPKKRADRDVFRNLIGGGHQQDGSASGKPQPEEHGDYVRPLGRIGFEGRFDYAAIGTVSNVASRLCDEAKPGQILISPRVLMEIEDAIAVEPVGEFTLKGIRRPLAAYNVLAVRAGQEPQAEQEDAGLRRRAHMERILFHN